MKKLPLVAALALVLSTPALADYTSTSSTHYGLGLATTRNITDSPTAFTGWMDLRPDLGLQVYASIPSTSPFSFGVAGMLKYFFGDPSGVGVHVGGGIGLGDVAQVGAGHAFMAIIDGVVGLHFPFPGSQSVRVQLDGGPSITIIDGNSNFSLGALSPALGLSVIYMF